MRIRSLGTLIGYWEHYPDTGNTGVLFITTLRIRTIANKNKKMRECKGTKRWSGDHHDHEAEGRFSSASLGNAGLQVCDQQTPGI